MSPGRTSPAASGSNANESPWRAPGDDSERGLNVYPPPRPTVLQEKLAELLRHRAAPDPRDARQQRGDRRLDPRLLRGRARPDPRLPADVRHVSALCGHSERRRRARAAARPSRTSRSIPTRILAALDASVKIVFICSPNNPTGQSMARADIERICRETAGPRARRHRRGVSRVRGRRRLPRLRNRYEHVVLLRTLSKFVSLAGVRCGLIVGAPGAHRVRAGRAAALHLPDAVDRARPTGAVAGLVEGVRGARRRAEARAREAVGGAARRAAGRAGLSQRRQLHSRAGRATAKRFARRRAAPNILVRTFDDPLLKNCVRITVGRPADNDQLLQAVSGAERISHA